MGLDFGAQDRTDKKNSKKKWLPDLEFPQNMSVL